MPAYHTMDDPHAFASVVSGAPDVHALNPDEFRAWLAQRIAEQASNEVFQQKCRIRETIRRHLPSLERRERLVRRARRAYESLPAAETVRKQELEISGLRRAVEGLTRAVAQGRSSPAKLAEYQHALAERSAWHRELSESVPERTRLVRAEASLDRLRDRIGLTQEEEKLHQLQRRRGQRADSLGSRFERVAAGAVDDVVMPQLRGDGVPLVHLRSATLGCARGEFDHLIVRTRQEPQSVEVLAMVETKRNPNDLVSGFVMRQENLAWLTGDATGYDPELYRTGTYLTGAFDRPATHVEHGRTFVFDRSSFQGFRRDPASGCFLARLWFITAPRPLNGVTSLELSRVLHRVSMDPGFDLDRDDRLRRLAATAGRFQSRDVIGLYRDQSLGNRIILCELEPKS